MERIDTVHKYPTDNKYVKEDNRDTAPLMSNVDHDREFRQQELGFVRHSSDPEKTDVSQQAVGNVSTRMTDMQVSEPSSVTQPASQSPSVGFTIWNSSPPTYYACQVPRAVSFTGAFVLSCFVYWCLGGWILGGIAYVLAGEICQRISVYYIKTFEILSSTVV